MKVKRYVASTSKEALRQVKEELGADAVILSNRKTSSGVEIMALAESEMSNLVQDQLPEAPPVATNVMPYELPEAGASHPYAMMQALTHNPMGIAKAG